MITEIVDETSFGEKINEPSVLVDFFTIWCQPCKVLKAMLSDVSSDIPILTVDIDMIPALAEKYRITAVPTVVIFKDGEPANRLVGLPSKQDLKRFIEGVS